MKGILYGIGTGPGDPELMTLKAVKCAKESDVIALPISGKEVVRKAVMTKAGECDQRILDACVAYQIVLPNVPELGQKPLLLCPMPMCKDKEKLKAIHDECAEAIGKLLEEGKSVGFLTLGDPTVYSTYLYVDKRVRTMGYEVEIISGITSFCASAARMGIGLVENSQSLHVIPSSYGVEEAGTLSGTKVLMKAGRKMKQVKESIKEHNQHFYMVENCGMENEKIYTNVEDVPDEASYYSLIMLKED